MTVEQLTETYWRTHRCPHCGAPGLFVHLYFEALECDACGTAWQPDPDDGHRHQWTPDPDDAGHALCECGARARRRFFIIRSRDSWRTDWLTLRDKTQSAWHAVSRHHTREAAEKALQRAERRAIKAGEDIWLT